MPTLPQKLEAIRAVCVENDPSILDLKFGCKVRMDLGNIDGFVIIENLYSDDTFTTCHSEKLYNHDSICEVYGRDLLLSDVLLAYDNARKLSWSKDKYGVVHLGHDATELIINWRLSRPSLDEQEEATVNLIYEILC